jgi:hypothetical protein
MIFLKLLCQFEPNCSNRPFVVHVQKYIRWVHQDDSHYLKYSILFKLTKLVWFQARMCLHFNCESIIRSWSSVKNTNSVFCVVMHLNFRDLWIEMFMQAISICFIYWDFCFRWYTWTVLWSVKIIWIWWVSPRKQLPVSWGLCRQRKAVIGNYMSAVGL